MGIDEVVQETYKEVLSILGIRTTCSKGLPYLGVDENTERREFERREFENVWENPVSPVSLNTRWERDAPLKREFSDSEYADIIRTQEFIDFSLRRASNYLRKDETSIAKIDPRIEQASPEEQKLTLAGVLTYHAISEYFPGFFDEFTRLQRDRAQLQAAFTDAPLEDVKATLSIMGREAGYYAAYSATMDGITLYVQTQIVPKESELEKMWDAHLFVRSRLNDWARREVNVKNLIEGITKQGKEPNMLVQEVPTLSEIEDTDVEGYLSLRA